MDDTRCNQYKGYDLTEINSGGNTRIIISFASDPISLCQNEAEAKELIDAIEDFIEPQEIH